MSDKLERLFDKRIGHIRVVCDMFADYHPDLSWIGEYSNTPKEGAVETGRSGRYYEYFNPQPGLEEYAQQDFKRMEAYNRGDWMMVGIRATVYFNGREIGVSYGLWGIEYEYSVDDYHLEIAREQIHDAIHDARQLIKGLTA